MFMKLVDTLRSNAQDDNVKRITFLHTGNYVIEYPI